MSRGPGQVQKLLLDRLREQSNPTTLESLRWNLPQQTESVLDSSGKLKTSWNTSLRRATLELIRTKHILAEHRRLASFEEAVVHFPGKSHSSFVRNLRLELLPVLLELSQRPAGMRVKYSSYDNEKYHWETLPIDEHRRLRKSWRVLEPQLIDLLPRLSGSGQHALFMLAAKCKSLFEKNSLTFRESFADLAQPCFDLREVSKDTKQQIVKLGESLMPPAEAKFLKLKSVVHTFVDVPRHRACRLKQETVFRLDQKRPDYIRQMDGYEPPAKRSKWMDYPRFTEWYDGSKHSDDLHLLIDQSIFQRFWFVQLAIASP